MSIEKKSDTPGETSEETVKKAPQPSFLRILVWFFLIWFISSAVFRLINARDRIELTYSDFKHQVRTGNVERITIKGRTITGSFEDDYRAPAESDGDSVAYRHFTSTTLPFNDETLMTLLEDNDVEIDAVEEGGSWLPYVLILALPWLLFIGYSIYASRKMQGRMQGMFGRGGLFGVGKSKAKRYRESDIEIGYDDVAGLENAKKDLSEIVDYLKKPEMFRSLGAEIPRGLLLIGPPGTGKTLLSRATAGEADVPFYSISGSEFIEMFVGVGASRVRDMFAKAKKNAPAIIFIDEIDSVGRARGAGLGGGHDEREQTLNQILAEMDGFEPHESVVVLAATNRPDVLDQALVRPGRFDRRVTLELPYRDARKKILLIHTRNVPLGDDVDIDRLAAATVGLSGADLHNLVNEAALLAGRKDNETVNAENFDEARDKILLGSRREEKIDNRERKLIAYHEAGHALLAVVLPHSDPLRKVTIIPRGRSMGSTEQTPERERHNYTMSWLRDRITVALGGRAAEKLIFGEYTNGAEQDLKEVTKIARKMVCNWGMSEAIGPVAFRRGEDHLFLGREMTREKDFSEHTGRIIDDEIRSLVTELEKKARSEIGKRNNQLDALAQALLVKETLDKSEIDAILKEHDDSPRESRELRDSNPQIESSAAGKQ